MAGRSLGGFVLFRDNASTLGRALDGLADTCDEVVAVDTGSTDGSAALVEARGLRRVEVPWRGFGAARAAAVKALSHHDAVFFLDSDEWLPDATVDTLRALRTRTEWPEAFTLRLRDWVTEGNSRFVLRTHRRKRWVATSAARWTDTQFVHEALPSHLRTERLQADIEHDFLPSLSSRSARNDTYGLLWALQAQLRGARARGKLPVLQHWTHFLRYALLKGAAFRGGWNGIAASWLVARYHADKYRWLEQLGRGEAAELQALAAAGDYGALFREVARFQGRRLGEQPSSRTGGA